MKRKRNAITIRFNENDPIQLELLTILSQTNIREVRGYIIADIYKKFKEVEHKSMSILEDRLLQIVERFSGNTDKIPTINTYTEVKNKEQTNKVDFSDFSISHKKEEIDYDKLLDNEINLGMK
jgi:hypothetical protein